MALTKTQIEYAKERVTKACRAYIEAKLGPEPEHKWTDDQKIAHISSGRATLKIIDLSWHSRLFDSFNYPEHPNAAAHKTWSEMAEVVKAEATAKADGILDRLVLSPDGLSVLSELAAAFGTNGSLRRL